MKPVVAILDDFFCDPEVLYSQITSGEFKDYKSPWDGVTYPGINSDIPLWIRSYIGAQLAAMFDQQIEIHALFARLTSKNLPEAPHKIHSDRIMGEYSFHTYISKEWPQGSGTSFWCHKTEGQRCTNETDLKVIKRDHDNTEQWLSTLFCHGKFNRALIHDSSIWHRADPVGGWGNCPSSGRVVLTAFFSGVKG